MNRYCKYLYYNDLLNESETIIQIGIKIILSQIYSVLRRDLDVISLFPFKKSYNGHLKSVRTT
jgi:hypothetical protein